VHTQEVLTAIQTVPSTVVDAETAARSYLTSADEKAWKHCCRESWPIPTC
jgi:CHASE3 domain sensor protein